MSKKIILIVAGVLAILAVSFIVLTRGPSAEVELLQTPSGSAETRYLVFQIFTGTADPAIPLGGEAILSALPTKASISSFVDNIASTIGTTGSEQQKLGFILGPISFDYSDADIRRMISDAFAIAEEKNIDVGFNIDDSIFWTKRTDLWNNPKNIESDGDIFLFRYREGVA